MDLVKTDLICKSTAFFKFLLSFSLKADNNIRRDGRPVIVFPEDLNTLAVFRRRIMAVHPPKRLITAALE